MGIHEIEIDDICPEEWTLVCEQLTYEAMTDDLRATLHQADKYLEHLKPYIEKGKALLEGD